MKLQVLIIQNLLIIVFGITIFYLDAVEFGDAGNTVLVICFCLIKSGFFIVTGFRKILIFSRSDLRYHHFLLFIGVSIALMIVSFSVDYICLFQINAESFSGLDAALAWYERVFKLFFFSVLVFSNLGIATVTPASIPAEFVMMIEGLLSFITIILVLSDFISLKESLSRPRSERGK